MTTDNMPPHPYGMLDWAKDHPMTRGFEMTTDNMPPPYNTDEDGVKVYTAEQVRAYAEQEVAKWKAYRLTANSCEQDGCAYEDMKQQTAELRAALKDARRILEHSSPSLGWVPDYDDLCARLDNMP